MYNACWHHHCELVKNAAVLSVWLFASPYYWRINKDDWVSRVFLYYLFSFSFKCTNGGMTCFLQPSGSTKGLKQVFGLDTKSLQRVWRLTTKFMQQNKRKLTCETQIQKQLLFISSVHFVFGALWTMLLAQTTHLHCCRAWNLFTFKAGKKKKKKDTEGGTWALTRGPGYQRLGGAWLFWIGALSNHPQHPSNLITLN